MAVRSKRLPLGKDDPIELSADTGLSGVNIMALTNSSEYVLWVGDGVEDGYELKPGKSLPGAITLGSGDRLGVHTAADRASVDVVLGFV